MRAGIAGVFANANVLADRAERATSRLDPHEGLGDMQIVLHAVARRARELGVRDMPYHISDHAGRWYFIKGAVRIRVGAHRNWTNCAAWVVEWKEDTGAIGLMARVPERLRSLWQALDWLQPAVVKRARERGVKPLRAGRMFFLPIRSEKDDFSALNHAGARIARGDKQTLVNLSDGECLALAGDVHWRAVPMRELKT